MGGTEARRGTEHPVKGWPRPEAPANPVPGRGHASQAARAGERRPRHPRGDQLRQVPAGAVRSAATHRGNGCAPPACFHPSRAAGNASGPAPRVLVHGCEAGKQAHTWPANHLGMHGKQPQQKHTAHCCGPHHLLVPPCRRLNVAVSVVDIAAHGPQAPLSFVTPPHTHTPPPVPLAPCVPPLVAGVCSLRPS